MVARQHQNTEIIPPNPAEFFESIRGLGYTLPAALADLVDNSITAGSGSIEITVDHLAKTPYIAIVDDGRGMNEELLIEAMRFGTQGSTGMRTLSDLGRFGFGLKTASLSQGRSVTVITRAATSRKPIFRRWDIDHVEKTRSWELDGELSAKGAEYMARLSAQATGTVVLIEKLDRVSFLDAPETRMDSHLATMLSSARDHLGMIFHRFIIENNLELRLGATRIKAWDPFLRSLSKRLPTETLYVGSGRITVTPYALPHHSRLTDDAYEQAAGPSDWARHQGFFIYRCRRLVIPGDWLNIGLPREEHYKLARIQVDLPNTMDKEWHLNVVKSHVLVPASIRDDFKRIALQVRREAASPYRARGEKEAPEAPRPIHSVWRREANNNGVRFRVDRSHPAIRAILHGGTGHDAAIAGVLKMIEETMPVAAILQEPRKSLDGPGTEFASDVINELLEAARHTEQYYCRTGKTLVEARVLVLNADPFLRAKAELEALLSKPVNN